MSNDLQKLLKKFMEEYESELNAARKDKDFKRPLGNIVRKDIAHLIGAQLPENIYKVKGSVGLEVGLMFHGLGYLISALRRQLKEECISYIFLIRLLRNCFLHLIKG